MVYRYRESLISTTTLPSTHLTDTLIVVLSAWPQGVIGAVDLVLSEIVHDKIWIYARRNDFVACVRSAHGERPCTRPVSREQPRRRVFNHETCRVESVLSLRATHLTPFLRAAARD